MVACDCDLFVDWFAVLAGSLLFAMTWWWIAVLVCVGLLLVLLGFCFACLCGLVDFLLVGGCVAQCFSGLMVAYLGYFEF